MICLDHTSAMIYLDHAATSMNKPDCVYYAVLAAMKNAGNASRGGHDAALAATRILYEARTEAAAIFHLSKPERLVFTANATESLNIAIKGLLSPTAHVITTSLEHNSVLRPLYEWQEKGLSLTILPADPQGNISYAAMTAAIKPSTRAIICTHASNVTGNLIDIAQVGSICKAHDLLFILDASQTAGIFPIDMEKMNIDVVCFTGHKTLLGPQGTGGLAIREGIAPSPFKSGGSGIHSYDKHHPHHMPDALEAGTPNIHGIAGLLAGMQYIRRQGAAALRQRELIYMNMFYEAVHKLQEVKVYGDFNVKQRAPIVSINIKDYDAATVADELNSRFQIAVRAGAHCAPLMHESLQTRRQGTVRFSFSHTNTENEIKAAIEAVQALATEEPQ